jgi:hypothetical protein
MHPKVAIDFAPTYFHLMTLTYDRALSSPFSSPLRTIGIYRYIPEFFRDGPEKRLTESIVEAQRDQSTVAANPDAGWAV